MMKENVKEVWHEVVQSVATEKMSNLQKIKCILNSCDILVDFEHILNSNQKIIKCISN